MGRKRQGKAGEEQPKKKSAPIRVDGDLAHKLGVISQVTGDEISEMVSPLIRPYVERRFAEVVKQLNKQVSPDADE